MDFRQITMLQKIKSGMAQFQANHPKFPLFLKAVSMKITTPEGKEYCTNVKLKQDDIALFDSFKAMQG